MEYVIGILGVVLLGLAVFAEQFGLDNDSGWGRGRMLIFGIVLVSRDMQVYTYNKERNHIINHEKDLESPYRSPRTLL